MKNKHLVLLFVGVLLVGLVSRWLPVRYRTFFETSLFRWEEKHVDRMVIAVAGKPELLFERIEQGWSVEQEARVTVVPETVVSEMLGALTGIASFELVKTGRPDTLGFEAGKALVVRLFRGKQVLETLEIGDEDTTSAGDCTYIRLPEHNGVYRVPGHLRARFGRMLDDFRSRVFVNWTADAIQHLKFDFDGKFSLWRTDTAWNITASCGRYSMPDESVEDWLNLFQQLNGLPFADYFDESWENELLYGTIELMVNKEVQTLRFFHGSPADLPDDIKGITKQRVNSLPAYVIHSSANPLNFFAVTDTGLIHRISRGL